MPFGLAGLTKVPLDRKQQMMIQSRELEALQQRIRETEARLKRQSVSFSNAATPSQNRRGGDSQTAGKDESS